MGVSSDISRYGAPRSTSAPLRVSTEMSTALPAYAWPITGRVGDQRCHAAQHLGRCRLAPQFPHDLAKDGVEGRRPARPGTSEWSVYGKPSSTFITQPRRFMARPAARKSAMSPRRSRKMRAYPRAVRMEEKDIHPRLACRLRKRDHRLATLGGTG